MRPVTCSRSSTGPPEPSWWTTSTRGWGRARCCSRRSGRYLWVSLRNEGKVKRFDLLGIEAPLEVFIGAGTSPESLLLTHDERTLIVSLRAQLARLAFVDFKTGR